MKHLTPVWLLIVLFSAALQAQKPANEELQTLKPAAEMNVQLFAAEPMVVNPSAIDVDTHGRVWVAEIQFYRGRAKEPGSDSIKVLEDTDGDGAADKVTTFAEGLFAPMSVCVAGDKVYVATSPDLWVFEDKNGDLKADGPPQKVLTGFGGHNHDHGAHSLVLGPDHKWWMSHGDTGFDVTGKDGSHIKFQWGAMLRGELDGTKLETVAVNFRNPYEICVNSFGESFCSDNDNDGNQSVRICWIMEGGDYGWFGSPPARVPAGTPFGEHWHFRGHIPGYVPATLVTGFGSPCGICYYESDAFGPRFKNMPLHCDAGPRECRAYPHELDGFGMRARSINFLTNAGDDYFRPDDVCTAPDGSLYVADWYDGGVGGHAYNDPTRGRIFKLVPKQGKLARREKPGPYDTIPAALLGLQSPNVATQFLAREKLLSAGEEAVLPVAGLLGDADPNVRARALWVLDRIGGHGTDYVLSALADKNPAFRALACRILARHGDKYADVVLPMCDDPAPEVRREVLLSIPKFKTAAARETFVKMAKACKGQDRYELEALNIAAGTNKDARLAMYKQLEKSGLTLDQLPLVQLLNPQAAADLLASQLAKTKLDSKTTASLLAAAGSLQEIEAGRGLLKLAANQDAPQDLRRMALDRLTQGVAGPWKDLRQDEDFSKTIAAMFDQPAVSEAALSAAAKLQLDSVGPKLLDLLSSSADAATKARALQAATALRLQGATEKIRPLLTSGDESLRTAALSALLDLQDLKTVREVLSGQQYPPQVRSAAADRLMESSSGALVLLRLLETKSLPEDLSQRVVKQASRHVDSNVRVLFEKFIPEADRPKKLGAAIKPEDILALAGDPVRGQGIYGSSAAQCKNCHRVQGLGAEIGPDLSLIGKKFDRAALLETILDPSKAISHEYKPYVLETSDGLVLAGFLAEKNDQYHAIRDITGKLHRVPNREVEQLIEQKKSLMPELILQDVTAQDAADLLAYLMTLREGELPVMSFRVAGPFPVHEASLDAELEPEKSAAKPDLTAKFENLPGKRTGWEIVTSDGLLGFPGIDTRRYDEERGLPAENVAHFFLTFVESAADQDAKLLVGSDDHVRIWLNGKAVHEHRGSRALGPAQDVVPIKLVSGRNVVLMKVVNAAGPGGAALAIRAVEPVQLRTE